MYELLQLEDERPYPYSCPNRWNTLLATDDEGVRHCQHCNERVCSKELSDAREDSAVLGRPDPVGMWEKRPLP